MTLPAVMTVLKEIGEARLPTLRGKRRARTLDVPAKGPDEIGVPLEELGLGGSPTRVVKIFKPKVARECRKLVARDEAAVENAVSELVAFLRKKDLL